MLKRTFQMKRVLQIMLSYFEALSQIPAQSNIDDQLSLLVPSGNLVNSIRQTISSIPPIIDSLKCAEKRHEKLLLSNLLLDIEESNDIGRTHGSINAIIWDYKCSNIDNLPGAKEWTYRYWEKFIRKLNEFNSIPEIQLNEIQVSKEIEKIYVTFRWKGPFQRFTSFFVDNISTKLWKIETNKNTSNQYSNIVNARILYLQAMAFWGNHRLIPIEIKDTHLTTRLKLQSAEFCDHPVDFPLAFTEEEYLTKYIAKEFHPDFTEKITDLEVNLSEEIVRIAKNIDNGLIEEKYLNQYISWSKEIKDIKKIYARWVSE